ncbi:MAG TPA: flagellar basal body-associated FliL family protein [bacterium]|nr:flagellar basal body-associated FliL family protein [bacterium]
MAEEAQVAQTPSKPKRKVLLIAVVGVVVICAAIIFGGLYFIKSTTPGESDPNAATPVPLAGDTVKPLETKVLGSFVVNLAPPDESIFLAVDIVLAYRGDDKKQTEMLSAEVDARLPQIKHHVNMILSGKRKKDVSTPDGKERLNREILKKVNSLLTAGQIEEIYFDKIVTQGS